MQRDPVTWTPNDSRLFSKLYTLRILYSSNPLDAIPLFILATKKTNPFQKIISYYNPKINVSGKYKNRNYDIITGVGQVSPQLYHRYTYCSNNPTNYIDPSGKLVIPGPTGAVGGAIVGGVVGFGMGAYEGYKSGGWKGAIGGAFGGAVAGAIGGGIGGFVTGIVGGGVIGGFVGGITGHIIGDMINPKPLGSDDIILDEETETKPGKIK